MAQSEEDEVTSPNVGELDEQDLDDVSGGVISPTFDPTLVKLPSPMRKEGNHQPQMFPTEK